MHGTKPAIFPRLLLKMFIAALRLFPQGYIYIYIYSSCFFESNSLSIWSTIFVVVHAVLITTYKVKCFAFSRTDFVRSTFAILVLCTGLKHRCASFYDLSKSNVKDFF